MSWLTEGTFLIASKKGYKNIRIHSKDCDWSSTWLYNWLFVRLSLFREILQDDSNKYK